MYETYKNIKIEGVITILNFIKLSLNKIKEEIESPAELPVIARVIGTNPQQTIEGMMKFCFKFLGSI